MEIPDGYANLVFRYIYSTADADEMTSSIGFSWTTTAAIPADVDEILTALSTRYGGFVSNLVDYTGWTCYVHDGSISVIEGAAPNSGTFGTSTAAHLSTQAAYTIRKNTSLFGRHGRGRMLIPGVLTPQLDAAGHISSTQVSNQNDALELWNTDWGSTSLTPVLLHTESTPAPTVIDSFTVAPLLATTRHRYRN